MFPKNPSQHMTDLKMQECQSETKNAFLNPGTGIRKVIELSELMEQLMKAHHMKEFN